MSLFIGVGNTSLMARKWSVIWIIWTMTLPHGNNMITMHGIVMSQLSNSWIIHSCHHIYACCWVRRDLFLLWQMVANKWPGLQWFFLSILRMPLIFFIWNLNAVVKEGMRWQKTVTLICFLLLNIKHQHLKGTHFTKKKINWYGIICIFLKILVLTVALMCCTII